MGATGANRGGTQSGSAPRPHCPLSPPAVAWSVSGGSATVVASQRQAGGLAEEHRAKAAWRLSARSGGSACITHWTSPDAPLADASAVRIRAAASRGISSALSSALPGLRRLFRFLVAWRKVLHAFPRALEIELAEVLRELYGLVDDAL